jgi:hypothetical protein
MSHITDQTKNAIAALRNSGFARNEFSVRTARNYFIREGVRYHEYGDPIITVKTDKERSLSLVDACLTNGLDVTIFYINKVFRPPSFEYAHGSPGRLILVEILGTSFDSCYCANMEEIKELLEAKYE